MIVDSDWPEDFDWVAWGTDENREQALAGKPTYDDLVFYCRQLGREVSRSAIGRWAQQVNVFHRMKHAGLVARSALTGLADEKASQSQKAAAEMITAILINTLAGADEDEFTPKQVKELSQAVRDCAAVAIKSDQYTRTQISQKAKEAVQEITAIAGKKKIDPETLKAIREQVYGIVT